MAITVTTNSCELSKFSVPDERILALYATAEVSLPAADTTREVEMNLNVPGIYMFWNVVSGALYLGQGMNIRRRRVNHIHHLSNDKHPNKHFQRAWNKYGKDAFVFAVLQTCDVSLLDYKEQKIIDQFFGDNCYNKHKEARSPKGIKRSPEVCLKISAGQKRYASLPEVKEVRRLRMLELQEKTDPEVRKEWIMTAAKASHTPESEAARSAARAANLAKKLEALPPEQREQHMRNLESAARSRGKRKIKEGKPITAKERAALEKINYPIPD